MEDQLHALQRFAEALAEAAVQKEAAIKAHISTVHLEEVLTSPLEAEPTVALPA